MAYAVAYPFGIVGIILTMLLMQRVFAVGPERERKAQKVFGCGVVLGGIPIALPGTPAPVRLGLAGGPLIVALVLSQIGRAGPLIWYLTPGANFALREIGIVLFLACVGLKSGSRFLEVLISGSGVYWMLAGAFLTLVPLVLVDFVARIVLKLKFATICGV